MWGDATTEDESVATREGPVTHQEGHSHAGRKKSDSGSGGSNEGLCSADRMVIDGDYAWCVHVYLLSDNRRPVQIDLDYSIRVCTSGGGGSLTSIL
jgi:hypothetical protein